MAGEDPGVADGRARALRELARRISPDRLDRIWVFPPFRNGRKETGVVAAGCYTAGERHLLVTLAYRAEETGEGITFEVSVREEGEAPADRLPRIMTGVLRRLRDEPGDPETHEIAGSAARFRQVVEELDPAPTPEVRTERQE